MSERIEQPERTDGVHHVAFRTPDADSQMAWRERLAEIGLAVTPLKNRQCFRSICFRETGDVLFEIATDGPGFTRDEDVADLGSALSLPRLQEEDRAFLEERLPRIEVGEARATTEAD